MQNGLDMAPVFQPTSLSDRDAIDGIQTFLQPRDTSVRSGPCSDSPDSNLVGVWYFWIRHAPTDEEAGNSFYTYIKQLEHHGWNDENLASVGDHRVSKSESLLYYM